MRQLNLRLHNPRLRLGKNGRNIVILRNFRVYERKFFLRFIYFLTKNLRFRLLLSEKIDDIFSHDNLAQSSEWFQTPITEAC